METLQSLKDKPTVEWTMLPGFVFSCDELVAHTMQPAKSVRAVVEAFTVPEGERNATFTSLHAFNAAYTYPFIRRGPDEFLLLQYYGIAEALYETPFYWMCADEAYAPTALRHRGDFSEAFAAERLTRVFGSDRVFQNVEILKSKGETLGEIDILVLFGDRANGESSGGLGADTLDAVVLGRNFHIHAPGAALAVVVFKLRVRVLHPSILDGQP